MPTRITWNEEAPEITRHGFTDFLKTNRGWRAIRVFDGRAQGRFKVTRMGKRFYSRGSTANEYVVQLPALFRTYKGGPEAEPVQHRGFYPVHALPAPVRRRLDAIFDPEEGAVPLEGAAKAAEINALKQRIRDTLQQSMENRRTADGRLIFF